MNKSATGRAASSILRRRCLLVPLAVLSAAGFASAQTPGPAGKISATSPTSATDLAHSLQEVFEHVADVVGPATVQITATIESRPDPALFPGNDLPFYYGANQGTPSRIQGKSYGSGVIIRPDGYILTNDHVVQSANGARVLVTLSDKSSFWGTVQRDVASDLAVVKINAGRPLPFVSLSGAKAPRVGQWAINIGSPLNEQNIVTAGIVSAIHRVQKIEAEDEQRTERFFADLIVTDAPINFGNSGGPLLNIDGELIGINVAMSSRGAVGSALGFAIPAKIAKAVSDQLISKGKVTRSTLGITPANIPGFLSQRIGRDKGAYVRQVGLETPAEHAGIQPGDIITQFGTEAIDDAGTLRFAINMATPHTKIPITLLRAGKTQTVLASLEPSEVLVTDPLPVSYDLVKAPAPRLTAQDLGLRLRGVSAAYSALHEIHPPIRGVIVSGVARESPAYDAEIERNCVITAVNGNPVTSLESLDAALAAFKSNDIIVLSVFLPRNEEHMAQRGVFNIAVP